VLSDEAVEAVESAFLRGISVPKRSLEDEETLQIGSHAASKQRLHRGTGSASARRRFNATLT
jgi:hypothetical protein